MSDPTRDLADPIKVNPTRDLGTLIRARKLGIQLTDTQIAYMDELTEQRRRNKIRSASMLQLRAAVEAAELAAAEPLVDDHLPAWSDNAPGSYLICRQGCEIARDETTRWFSVDGATFLSDDLLEQKVDTSALPDGVLALTPEAFEADPVGAIRARVTDQAESTTLIQLMLRQLRPQHQELIEKWLTNADEPLRLELERVLAQWDEDDPRRGPVHFWPALGPSIKEQKKAELEREAIRIEALRNGPQITTREDVGL